MNHLRIYGKLYYWNVHVNFISKSNDINPIMVLITIDFQKNNYKRFYNLSNILIQVISIHTR